MTITFVPDPLWVGKGKPPEIIKAYAMRKLFKSGMSVGDIARYYKTSYALAYKAIKPPHQAVSSPTSTATKALTPERLKALTKSQLDKIIQTRHPDARQKARIEAALAEWITRYGEYS